jgi:hypothetical protein
MKTIITKNVAVVGEALTVHAFPGVVAIQLKQGGNQLQVPNSALDELIDSLIEFRTQRNAEHTLKDVLTIEPKKPE